MEQAILNLQHLTKSFDGKKILDDLSIDIGRNEFVTLLGPSGCGKTTTLRIIGGFATPDEGKVIFEGKDIRICLRISVISTLYFRNIRCFPI